MSENKLVHAYSLCNTRTVLDIKKADSLYKLPQLLGGCSKSLFFHFIFFYPLNVAEMMNNNNIDYLPSG